jgi:hypothetical protein
MSRRTIVSLAASVIVGISCTALLRTQEYLGAPSRFALSASRDFVIIALWVGLTSRPEIQCGYFRFTPIN